MARAAKSRRKAPPKSDPAALGDSCPNCSESLTSLDTFCPACGTVLPGGEEE